jgi:hypothetical protein
MGGAPLDNPFAPVADDVAAATLAAAWPVVDLAGGFVRWRESARALVPQAAVSGGTAAR